MRLLPRAFVVALVAASSACVAPPPPAPTVIAPTRLLIRDFAVDPAQVTLDTSVRAASGGDEARVIDAHAAQSVLAQTLLYRMRQLGWSASRAEAAPAPTVGALVIDGRISRIDEGDRTQRAQGGGHAAVDGEVHLYSSQTTDPASPQPAVEVAVLSASSQDADVPGMAGAGAASAAALNSGGQRSRQLLRAGVTAEARRLGNRLADEIAKTFSQKGWTPPHG